MNSAVIIAATQAARKKQSARATTQVSHSASTAPRHEEVRRTENPVYVPGYIPPPRIDLSDDAEEGDSYEDDGCSCFSRFTR